jgi:hypothetical protein
MVLRVSVSLDRKASTRQRGSLQYRLDHSEQPVCVGTIHEKYAAPFAGLLAVELAHAVIGDRLKQETCQIGNSVAFALRSEGAFGQREMRNNSLFHQNLMPKLGQTASG